MDQQDFPTYLTLAQAAELTALSINTIRRRISDGTIRRTGAAGARSASASKTSKQPSAASRQLAGDVELDLCPGIG